MKKGIEAIDIIYKQELDFLSLARLNLLKKNTHLQELLLKKDNEVDTSLPPMNNSSCTAPSGQPFTLNPSFQIISVGGIKVIPLPATVPIIVSSLMSPTLVLIAIIWIMIRKKIWNI